MLNTTPLKNSVSVRIVPNPFSTTPPQVEKRISEIWDTEQKKRGEKLFNGPVLSFLKLQGEVIEAFLTDYRSYVAQVRDKSLYNTLRICNLAVSGLLTLDSKIVFGKRASHVTMYAERWELPPSGGVTPQEGKDLKNIIEDQFFTELHEELGWTHEHISSWKPFLLVEDTESHSIDIAIEATLTTSLNGLHSQARSDEYSELVAVAPSDIRNFCSSRSVVQVSLEILKAKKLI